MAEREPGVMGWIRANSPTLESLEENRFLRPFAHRIAHSELWRFTRRSVPRGVALGLLVGIFLLIPGVQILGVVMLALPCRANIPIGAAMTFLSNPVTTPFLLAASVWTGNALFGLDADIATWRRLVDSGAGVGEWLAWLASSAAPALLSGLLIISVIAAAVGYVVAAVGWNMWVRHKWRLRLLRRRQQHRSA